WRSFGDKSRILARPQAPADQATAREQKVARRFACVSQVVIDGLTGLVRQLELDRPSCLPLPDRCAVDRVTVGCNVLDLEGHDIAATKLAIDRQIEHGQVACPPSTISRVLIAHTSFGPTRGLAPISLPLFQGVQGGCSKSRLPLSDMVVLLGYRRRGACVAAAAGAPKLCQLSEGCGCKEQTTRTRPVGS